MMAEDFVLGEVLRAAVPMLRLQYADTPDWRLREIATDAADQLAHSGDLLQFRSSRGKMAGAFNLMARSIAAQSLLNPKLDWLAMIDQLECDESRAFAEGNTTG